MGKFITILLVISGFFISGSKAQVKGGYLYSTSMPYGTLDIRTTISTSTYYYLQEGKTFAYRESSPGVRTNKYRDMTTWESSPYLQGNLRYKSGTTDKFVMNYRLLMPVGYRSYSPGYPLIVVMHGGGERANCFYTSCYHSGWDYEPNANLPKAPTTIDHKLLNNDHHLLLGGKEHLDARNSAGSKLPNDATLSSRAFPGFVLFAQMFNEWNPQEVQHVIRLIRLHCAKYRIDQNRIYIHGLSIGGYAVYEAVKRAPWLFAAALPIAANKDANLFTEKMESRVAHIPFWMFQGGKDTNPTPTYTKNVVTKLRNAGAIVRYTEFPTLGHAVWNSAYAQPDFFSWMLSKNISNLHAYKGNTVIVRSTGTYPKLTLPIGFFAYQWQKNGVALSTTGNTLTVTSAGNYRARFSRVANPTSTQWNRWSNYVAITEGTTATGLDEAIVMEESITADPTVEVFPNPTTPDNVNVEYTGAQPLRITLVDQFGRQIYEELFDPNETGSSKLAMKSTLADGLYFMIIQDGEREFKKRVFIRN
jgi:predicted esterase